MIGEIAGVRAYQSKSKKGYGGALVAFYKKTV